MNSRFAGQSVDVVVGGQYGSEGKGQIAAHLSPEYKVLVRVGGPNAGHSVYAEPEIHKFHHLPSGTRSSDAKLVLGAGAVIWIPKLLEEIETHGVGPERLVIDPKAMLIEPVDREFENATLAKEIGSTAQGVGAATARKVMRTAAPVDVRLAGDADELKHFIADTQEQLGEASQTGAPIMLEGTQGTGLSLHHGHYPHVTSRDTTVAACLSESGLPPLSVRHIVMVCRTYPIRVQSPEGGTSGHMSQEIELDTIASRSGISIEELRSTERTTTTNRSRRIAEFDMNQVRRSVALNGPTDIALTFVDYLGIENRKARSYEELNDAAKQLTDEIEHETGVPVTLFSNRFHTEGVIDRRDWKRGSR